MRLLKTTLPAGALVLALAGSAIAQTPAQQPPPKPTTGTQPPPKTTPAQPPATPPAAAQPAPKPATPPTPFPQDSKIAFVDVQAIASSSTAGKEATQKLTALTTKKQAEIAEKNKQLQAAQTKLQSGAGVLSESARDQLSKEIDRMQRDIQFANQNAQAEVNEMQNDLQAEFQKKLMPVIEEIAKEKGLYAVFTADAPVAFVHPGLNITDEVIKRFDTKKQ
jgi:outer membrane protein